MFIRESECKHCGAPLGVSPCTKQYYDLAKDKGRSCRNHHDHEIEDDVDVEQIEGVVYTLSTCSDCRTLY